MNTGRTYAQQLLDEETQYWRDLAPADYDRAISALLDGINATAPPSERVETLLALASRTLRRHAPALVGSRARCAELLVVAGSEGAEPTRRLRVHQLFLLAWLHLGAVAERGPASIESSPPLPEGVVLPTGADPEAIDDPVLREQAKEAARRHLEEIERWNAKQRALDHLNTLAHLARTVYPAFIGDDETGRELLAAMSLAAGLPPGLRQTLAAASG